jgi:hypothetical protein
MKSWIVIPINLFVCFSMHAELSSEILQLKKELDDLKTARQEVAASKTDDKVTQLIAIQKETTQKLAQMVEYWPQVKAEFDGACAATFDRCREVARSCCEQLSCNALDPKASQETIKALKDALAACKVNALTKEGSTLCIQCNALVEIMFDAAMQTGNKRVTEELKPYTIQYWGVAKKK